MSNVNPKDILLGVEATLTASPTLVTAACLKELQIGHTIDHSSGMPAANIYLDTFTNPIADTVSYERVYGVNIDIWQEITNKSKRNAELDLANALHQILNRLSATGGTPPTWQLGVAVELTEIVAGQIRLVEGSPGPMLLAPIKLNVMTLIQNPS